MKREDDVDMAAGNASVVGLTASGASKRPRDALDDDAEPSLAERRTHRKTGERVLFADVMAQEREMERISYEKKVSGVVVHLRKGEKSASPSGGQSAKSKKQKRAEERRSQRQALRRNMSPRSPDGGPRVALRGGVSLVDLDEGTPRKRRFTRDEDAIQVVLHSTAWRNVQLENAPLSVLPDKPDVSPPFSLAFDRPLADYDAELAVKCALSPAFGNPSPVTLLSGSLAELDEKVRELIEEATPLVKKCHAVRANAIIANTRQQVAAYLLDLPATRVKAAAIGALPLQISRLEKVAVRKILKNMTFATGKAPEPHYSVGRTESDHSEQLYPEKVTYLSKIAPIRRATTCMLSRGTYRVEDDPIIRFVPYFSSGSGDKPQTPQFGGMEPHKETLVGLDDEINECVLRYVVTGCGGHQAVFDALQRTGDFAQPFADYAAIAQRVTREQVYKKQLQKLESLGDGDISGHAKQATANLLEDCEAMRSGAKLCDRLQPLPTRLVLNHLREDAARTGVRSALSGRYEDMGVKYQEFFCRRCCMYNCRNHGRKQPLPAVRTDPSYPVVKSSSKLWRRVEEQHMGEDNTDQTVDDADVPSDTEPSEYPMETEEPSSHHAPDDSAQTVEEQTSTQDPAGNGNNAEEDLAGSSMRRSVRAHTAASTKASSLLRAQRPHERKRVSYARSKADPQADISEYLGFDGVYRAFTHAKKTELLSSDARCGAHCSKIATDSIDEEPSAGSGPSNRKTLDSSEVVLLTKLEKSIGPISCVLSAMLGTRSCAEIAEFLRQRDSLTAEGELCELDLLRSGVLGRNRERSNGVLGNSHEHLRRTRFQRMKDRGANHEYVPCNHEGSCDSAQCSCMRRDHYCEKSCGCSRDCSNRFPGCHCEAGQCRTSACPCYFAARECDPDVCVSCGASELPVLMADEDKKHKRSEQLKICGNVNIIRGQMRKIGVALSETHGWGAYALEKVKKGDFIYEYTGSLLSQDEAERRGNVYDKTTISFLFDLNEDSVVDATRKGNKSKFANHNSTDPKCKARIMLVNGDHRIGIFAKEDLEVGDELFFDYGYNGVIPDWSQARIGTGKDAPSVEEEEPSATPVDVKAD
ncbi:hypothetical protein BBJ28_00011776 [Nothophytophthora sp. Chile5]|nr:hypothetical protein BBJ28_00011776 [Nothophytophthora sp. Chile5]